MSSVQRDHCSRCQDCNRCQCTISDIPCCRDIVSLPAFTAIALSFGSLLQELACFMRSLHTGNAAGDASRPDSSSMGSLILCFWRVGALASWCFPCLRVPAHYFGVLPRWWYTTCTRGGVQHWAGSSHAPRARHANAASCGRRCWELYHFLSRKVMTEHNLNCWA